MVRRSAVAYIAQPRERASMVLPIWLTENGTFVLVRNWARFDGDAVASVPSGW
jgi:hypothetical protein